MKFLGIYPVFLADIGGMACFALAALFMSIQWWLCPLVGILTWRALAR